MNSIFRTTLFIVLIMLLSCNSKSKQNEIKKSENQEVSAPENKLSKAELLLEEVVKAHGGELYGKAHYGFTFRKKEYAFKNTGNRYHYTMRSIKNQDTIQDVLDNGTLTRTINGVTTELSEKDISKYSQALNSVIYFATLPYKLQDKAVRKVYKGETRIKGQNYEVLRVSFDQEGGGKDFDDVFMYWINSETKTIDYLAYSYSTNDGGVRFRSAFNPRTVKGIRFQDYINYEAPIGTSLKDLPSLFEKGKLKELSRIITEDVRILK